MNTQTEIPYRLDLITFERHRSRYFQLLDPWVKGIINREITHLMYGEMLLVLKTHHSFAYFTDTPPSRHSFEDWKSYITKKNVLIASGENP